MQTSSLATYESFSVPCDISFSYPCTQTFLFSMVHRCHFNALLFVFL